MVHITSRKCPVLKLCKFIKNRPDIKTNLFFFFGIAIRRRRSPLTRMSEQPYGADQSENYIVERIVITACPRFKPETTAVWPCHLVGSILFLRGFFFFVLGRRRDIYRACGQRYDRTVHKNVIYVVQNESV